MPSVNDLEREFLVETLASLVANADDLSLNDLRYIYYLAAVNGDLPGGGGGGGGDGYVLEEQTFSSAPTGSQLSRTLNYAVATSNPDLMEFWIQGVLRAWANEWGGWRFRNPYSSWADAGVRFIVDDGDNTNGNAVELVDRTASAPASPADVKWGIRWSDGATMRNGNVVNGVFVLTASQTALDVPATLPVNTIVWQDD